MSKVKPHLGQVRSLFLAKSIALPHRGIYAFRFPGMDTDISRK